MRLIFTSLVLLTLISFSPVLGKSDSCLDAFRDFKPVEVKVTPTIQDYDSVAVITWYGECILAGSAKGLLLYDINQPNTPIILARVNTRAVTNIAVNPQSMTIAFNVAEEPTVYFVNSDKTVSSRKAQGDAVTDISYSSDGSLLAVASSKIDKEYGMYFDSTVEILNNAQKIVAHIPTNPDRTWVIVTKSIFSADNQHLLTHDNRQGYLGDEATYWDIQTGKKIWDYGDLFRNRKPIPDTDPLYFNMLSMNGHIVALGGLDAVMDWDDYYGTAVHLWDVNTQQRLGYIIISRRGGRNDHPLNDLSLNHDGSILVTAQDNGVVRFWNTSDDSEISKSIQETVSVTHILYDANEKYLALQFAQGVSIWDLETRQKISSFELLNAD